jgi:tetratricopeptide (TPR) repeat protein
VALMPGAALEDAERACAGSDCPRAIGLFEEAVARRPHDFRLHYRLGLCYGGDCRAHGLVHPEMAVAYLRQARRLMGTTPGKDRAAVVDQLGSALCHGGSAPRPAALREAIECHEEAADIYRSLEMADDWGRAQFNLGNSCCELSEIAGEDHWQEAVFHYQESLRVRTREKDPQRHAAVLENLGSAYRQIAGGSAGENVKKSIKCYQSALRIYTAGSPSIKKAALENNLGNAYLSLPAEGPAAVARNAGRALRHFDRALRVPSLDKHSRVYGITQYNRAQAFCRLAQTPAGGNPRAAAACLEEAFAAFQSCGENRYRELARAQLDRICGMR